MVVWLAATLSAALLVHSPAAFTRRPCVSSGRAAVKMTSDFDTLFEAGSESIKAGDFAQARAFFDEAAIIDPSHAPTKAILEKLALLAPPDSAAMDDDDDDDADDVNTPLFSLDGAVATQPAPSAVGPASAADAPDAADDEGAKVDMTWTDAPTDAPSSTLAPGATVGVLGGETPIGRRVLSALSASSFEAVPLASSYTATMAKVFEDAEALVVVSASAGGKGGVEPQAMRALLGALPAASLKRLLLLSSVGVERTDKLPFNLANVFGQLDQVRAMEQELVLAAAKAAAACTVVRVGKLKDDAPGAQGDAGGGGEASCELQAGDAFEGDVSASAVTSLLVQSLARDEVVNTTFSAGRPTPRSAGASSAAFGGWDDEFQRLVGPEVYRFAFKSTIAPARVLGWLRTWARELVDTPGSGLTSPLEVVDVPDGALLRFVPRDGAGGSGAYADRDAAEAADDERESSAKGGGAKGEGGLLLVAEAQTTNAESARVRVRRAEMRGGAVPKPMSEAAVLEKLGRDLGLLDKARAAR